MRRTLAFLCFFVALLNVMGCRSSSRETPKQPFVVERGASAHEIATALKQQNLIRHRWTFLIWIKMAPGKAPPIRPGRYALSPRQSGRAILHQLRQGPPPVRVTFPEGWTAKQMATLLEAQKVTPAAPFVEKVKQGKFEGMLFPDTYLFDQQSDADSIIRRMQQRYLQQRPADFLAQAKMLRLTEQQLVTLASIVEREARVPEERPVIAGVFLNRLRKGWRLESCATVEYALGAWKPRLTYKDLEVASPYNTYRRSGLPPGPIGNPGAAALFAAAHPAPTDMMFFVAQGDGTHRFSKYYNDHLNAQKKKIKKPLP